MLLPNFIAVYGSLRQGQPAHDLVSQPAFGFVCTDRVHGTLYNLGAYPGVEFNTEKRSFEVEIYRIRDPQALWPIHRYEGYRGSDYNDNLFTPRLIRTINFNIRALCYEYTGRYPIATPRNDGTPTTREDHIISNGSWPVFLQETAAA